MLEALFSGEEAYGKYLDLVHHHHVYLNLKGSKKGGDLESKSEQFDYLRYIEEFDNFDAIPETIHSTSSYAKYVSDLCAYLVSYFKRAKPLFDIQSVQDIELSELLSQSNSDGYSKAKVFCEPCNHFFANEAVYNGHLGGKKHLRAVEKTKDGSELSNSEKKKIEPNFQDTGVSAVGNVKNSNLDRSVKNSVVYNERIISRLASILGETRQETRLNVERKQSRTYEERLNDLIAEETAAPLDASAPEFTSASIGDDRIYNPLNLPLDWDGKPIPYWLWKLHGLGVRFPCEICGNQVYMGRRSFDHHFSEWRHINGMKALGIPNSPHFFQITNVQEALDLWEQLKKNAKTEIFRPEAMEECEDAMGNVYTRKTFEDLRRQGLL